MIENGRLHSFEDFVELAGKRIPPGTRLATFDQQFAGLVAAGDPTPFKAFRRREFDETAALLGSFRDDAAPETLLREELVLTAEVWKTARRWQARGALLFGLSDKPDEAALPVEGSDTEPLHRIRTHIVGS
jgi:hypothetical protein